MKTIETKRDKLNHYAGLAMQGILSDYKTLKEIESCLVGNEESNDVIAEMSYLLARSMIEEEKKYNKYLKDTISVKDEIKKSGDLTLKEQEKQLIKLVLGKYGWNRKKAAEELGISERTICRKIKTFNLTEE